MNPATASCIDRIIGYLDQKARDQGIGLPPETESLFNAEVLDSFGLLEFVGFMEEELNLDISDEDLLAGNFETVAKIRSYINKRMGV
jgi:acyl carrier protein